MVVAWRVVAPSLRRSIDQSKQLFSVVVGADAVPFARPWPEDIDEGWVVDVGR
jgi:hypothetical protein